MPDFPQNPYLNQIVTWKGYEYQWNGQQWVNLTAPDPTTVPVYISASPPAPPLLQGSFWYDTVGNELYIWVLELGENQWVPVSGTTEPCPYVYVSVSAPSDPTNGTLWYQPHTSTLSIYVVALSGNEWRVIASNSPTPQPPCVIVSASPPLNPTLGLLWYKTTNHSLYVWVVTPSGSSWELVSSSSATVKPTVYVSTTAPSAPLQGDLWWQPLSEELKVWNVSITGNSWLLVADNTPQPQTPPVYISIDEPPNPKLRYLWFNPQVSELKVWDGLVWELVSTTSTPLPPPSYVSISPPTNPIEGELWFNPTTGILSVWYIDLDGGQWLATIPYALIEAAGQAAQSAEEAAQSAALAEYYAQQAASYFGEVLIDSTQTGIIYVGKAPAGSLETASVWTIRRSIFDSVGELVSVGAATNVAWTNRYTIPYS